MNDGIDQLTLTRLKELTDLSLPLWTKYIWHLEARQERVLVPGVGGLLAAAVALVSDIARVEAWNDAESYLIAKGYYVERVIATWRGLVQTSDLRPAFADSDLLSCPRCGHHFGDEGSAR